MIYVALLRGVNVGGNTLVPMAALKQDFERLGYHNVMTYINSGNVIFTSAIDDVRSLEVAIETMIEKQYGCAVRTIVKSYEEMERVVQAIPKSWLATTTQKSNVIFLHHTIDTPAIVLKFHLKHSIEELVYHPGVIFWAADTGALTQTAMIGLSKATLYKAMTVRNLNTTRKLFELMQKTAASASMA